MKDIATQLAEGYNSIKNAIFKRNKKNPNELRTIRILKSNLNIAKDKKINNYSSNSIKTTRVKIENMSPMYLEVFQKCGIPPRNLEYSVAEHFFQI